MVLKRKFNLDGTVSKWKARAVLKGYAQRPNIDYGETFAPVGKLETFRYMCKVANSRDWNLRQIDFKNAFLNAEMDRELYMELPPGLQYVMDTSTLARGTVCRLVRGLYGAKQSPALWNKTLDTYLRGLGFVPSGNDSCLYFRERTSVPRSSQKGKRAPGPPGPSGRSEKGEGPQKGSRPRKGATSSRTHKKGLKCPGLLRGV